MKTTSNLRSIFCRAPIFWLWLPWCGGYSIVVSAGFVPVGFGFWSVVGLVFSVLTLTTLEVFGEKWSRIIWGLSFGIAALLVSMAWWNLRIHSNPVLEWWKDSPPREVYLRLDVLKVDRVPLPERAGVVEFHGRYLDTVRYGCFKTMPMSMDCRLYTLGVKIPLRKGDRVVARGVLYPPSSFSPEQFVLRQGAVLSIEHRATEWSLNTLRQTLLAKVVDALEAGEPEGKPYSGYIQSMLTGDKRYLEYRDKKRFREAGVMHFFAISGFHLTIVAAICFTFFQLLGLSRQWSTTWMLVFCALYVWLTGSPVSAQRALLMMTIYFAAQWCRRKPDALAATVLAGWIILLIAPQQLFQPGYQLSFVVVIGILTQALPLHAWLSEVCKKRFQEVNEQSTPLRKALGVIREYFVGSFAVSWCAFWLSAPIVATYFGKVPFIAILLNTLLAPLFALTMLTGFLSAVFGLIGGVWISAFFNHAVWMELSAVDGLIQMGESLHMTWSHDSNPASATLGVVAMLGIGTLWNLSGVKSRYLLLCIPLISLCSILF